MTVLPTLLDVVRQRALATGDLAARPAFTYLIDGEAVSSVLTYADLDAQARQLAARLQARTQRGDRVLLVYPPSVDYIVAFYACVYAGVIAVPALSPSSARTLPRLRAIAADSRPTLALTQQELLRSIEKMAQGVDGSRSADVLASLQWQATDGPSEGTAADWRAPALAADDIVFLQYTSGSTGTPKGVMVSHANLLANAEHNRQTYGIPEGSTFVSWLPPHHDFGLIGAIVLPVVAGCHCVQFPPASFLMRPYRWLKLISEHRAYITGAPDFAYELCVQRVTDEQKRHLDLSHLVVAVNGAERVRPDTLRRFVEAFGSCGLRPDALIPSYGMAESVLLVTAAGRGADGSTPGTWKLDRAALESRRVISAAADARDAVEVVRTGRARTGNHRVAIVDPATGEALPDERVGEIWVRGPSVASGYWGRGRESDATFRAALPGQTGCWLRSGDLGFLSQGGLYVTGRLKEVMIFNGRNVYPQDVEMTVEALDPAFRANGCAAFVLEDDAVARLVVVQEIEARRQPEVDHLVARLRADLAERHEIVTLEAVLLVRPGHVPRTSSGKIQRGRCRQMYVDGEFAPVWSWQRERDQASAASNTQPIGETEQRLLVLWEELFGRSGIGTEDNFFSLGGHSLLATQLSARVSQMFGVEVPLLALFEAPTISGIARFIDCARLTDTGYPQRAVVPMGNGAQAESTAPLSFAQQRFWFLEQYARGNSFYAIPLVLSLVQPVDAQHLQRAIHALVARHQTLRTTFECHDGMPLQRVHGQFELPLTVHDWTALDPAAARTRVAEEIAAEAARPFDLCTQLPLRASLLLTAHDALLLLTLHHIAADGASVPVIVAELGRLYAASRQGVPATLSPLPAEYLDYVTWEAGEASGERLESRTAWWRDTLAGAPTKLELPGARVPVTSNRLRRGGAIAMRLPVALTRRLDELSRRHGVTSFTVLVTAMGALVHRLGGKSDFCLAIFSANRPAGTEGLVGNFINVVPLRQRIQGGSSFSELLQPNGRAVLAAHQHQIPYELLLRDVVPPSERTGAAAYAQLVMNFHSELDVWPESAGQGQVLQVTGRHVDHVTHVMFDLKVEVRALRPQPDSDGAQTEVEFEYDGDLYERQTIERLAAQYRRVLELVVERPDTAIGELALLTQAERDQQLLTWNDTGTDYAEAGEALHQLVERQVQRTPEAIALVHEGGTLSYDQLNRRANQLAHHLRQCGIGRDSLVALCMQRSPELIVGLLGILKAGAGYVPLDPQHPRQRLAYMLQDTGARVLLTEQALLEHLGALDTHVLCLDRDAAVLDARPTDNPALPFHPDQLAYCIYTSGSTGQPKGAMNSHRAIVNRLLWMQAQYRLGAQDTVLQKTPCTFDVSVWEFFWPLLTGARLAIARPEGHKDPHYLAQAIRQYQVTTAHFVPAMLQAFLARIEQPLPCLRQVFASGEALPATVQRQFRQRYPRVALHNLYGPTEAAVDVSHWACTQDGDTVPIGHPVANTRLYLLDAQLQPVPVGATAEIYIAGIQLARGYLRRPELTAERFIPDPYGEPGSRMYRSGDLGRYRADGSIEYLGRTDHQVKLRGLRIELGEIENVLLASPGIREAAVLVRQHLGEGRLVGYVSLHDGHEVQQSTLEQATLEQAKARLQAQLPDYMVPGDWVVLPTLPLNANGKIDRKTLPEPKGRAQDPEHVEPQTETQKLLARIWAELLGVERVGLNDHFFALGGHSLLATQVVSRLREARAIELPLRTVFEAPGLAELAARVQSMAPKPRALARIAKTTRERPPVTSFAQQRLWFLEQYERGTSRYNMAVACRVKGVLDEEALERAFNDIVQRHEVLRTVFVAGPEGPVQRIAERLEIALVRVDAIGQAEASWQQQIRLEAQAPFDLAHGPLLRARLLRLASDEHLVLLTLHHIVSDGWSMGVLLRELGACYRARARGQTPQLPELPIQYADYAVWQREWLKGDVLQQQLDHWRQTLQGAPAILELPTDHPRPAQPRRPGAVVQFQIDAALGQRLQRLSQSHQASLFMTLAAALNIVLHRYSQQDDLCIGYPVANRQRAEVEGLIGFFVNTLVLRTRIRPHDDFHALLRQVREAVLDADAHQDLPFEKLVEELKPQRSLNQTPLFQVMLAFYNADHGAELDLPGLSTEVLDPVERTAKFDLSLEISLRQGCLHGSLEYDGDLYERQTIERLAAQYRRVLELVVERPDTAIGELALLTQAERDQQLLTWNDTGTDYAEAGEALHQLVERQVQRTPEAIALVHEGGTLSYDQLNRRANQLAHHLRQCGIGRDSLVALCMQRSPELIVGLLGILKAGAGYVPLDPQHPRQRLAYMLQDTRARVLLTEQALLEHLGALDTHVLCLDRDAAVLDARPTDNPALPFHPDQLAYCIYTSGSTGQPKGALVSHRGIANLHRAQVAWFEVSQVDRVLQFASIGFDAFVFDVVMAFGAGAALVLRGEELDERLVDWVIDSGVTIATLPPALLARLSFARAADLRCVISAGEACRPEHLKAVPPGCRFVNAYGPTETTIWATAHRADGTPASQTNIPIGRPVAGLRVRILDDCLQLLPVGAVGQVHIAGPGLARGYLDRPDLTAEKFIPDPYGEAGSRMYRTGDLGRYRTDGSIEYLGRTDHQVKLRGMRIELGEIENALLGTPGVREAAVLLCQDAPDETRLVAYLALHEGQEAAASLVEAEARLRSQMPDYMVPSAWVVLPALPLNTSGKIDRKALPKPQGRAKEGAPYVAPVTGTQKLLARIWAELLHVERVGLNDSFFALGGHSLLATQVAGRIGEQLSVSAPLRLFFETPTVAAIAERIDALVASQAANPVGVIRRQARRRDTAPSPINTTE